VDGALECDRLVLVSARVDDDDPGDVLRSEDRRGKNDIAN
jgi:hypothetical protein